MLILQGAGDSGKSVLASLIASFFDESLIGSVDAFRLGDRFAMSALVDKRLAVSMDLSDASLKEQAVATIKQITGGDLLMIEEKYKRPYPAKVNCKLLFGSNHLLRLSSEDAAFSRRIMLIPFRYSVPKDRQDIHLLDRLKTERNGILLLALCAYGQFLKRGCTTFTGDDVYTMQTSQEGDEMETYTDGVEAFLAQCCCPSKDGFVSTENLHAHYLAFCKSTMRPFVSNHQTFSRYVSKSLRALVPEAKLEKRREMGLPKNGYAGITLVVQ